MTEECQDTQLVKLKTDLQIVDEKIAELRNNIPLSKRSSNHNLEIVMEQIKRNRFREAIKLLEYSIHKKEKMEEKPPHDISDLENIEDVDDIPENKEEPYWG